MVARAVAKVAPKHFPVPMVVVNPAGGAGIPGTGAGGERQAGRLHPSLRLRFRGGSGDSSHDETALRSVQRPLPVCQITIASLVIVVPSSNPAKSLKEFVDGPKIRNGHHRRRLHQRGIR